MVKKLSMLPLAVSVAAFFAPERVLTQTYYSTANHSSYGFYGLWCPRPAFLLNAANNNADNYYKDSLSNFNDTSNDSFQVSGVIVVPLGGKVGANCQEISNTILESEQLKLEELRIRSSIEIAKECANIISLGITLDPKEFPILTRKCSAVSNSKNTSEEQN